LRSQGGENTIPPAGESRPGGCGGKARMEILDCHERLARLTMKERRQLMPDFRFAVRSSKGECDAWPAAVVGALVHIGWLAQLESDADLREGIAHVAYLLAEGLLDQEQLEAEAMRVIDCLLEWGWAAEEAAAGTN